MSLVVPGPDEVREVMKRFWSRYFYRDCEGVDAFLQEWGGGRDGTRDFMDVSPNSSDTTGNREVEKRGRDRVSSSTDMEE